VRSIIALAVSLSGSEHILIGKVVDKKSVAWASEDEARAHLSRIGWTNQRFLISEEVEATGMVRRLWDDQSVTLQTEGDPQFTYHRGGPKGGAKISKSAINAAQD
jgi:hypothetical protein